MDNQIVEVKLSLVLGNWEIEVKKEFAPQYGGGSQVFTRCGGPGIHEALRRAAEMVTLTPAYRDTLAAHPFVASQDHGLCSSCGHHRGDPIHQVR